MSDLEYSPVEIIAAKQAGGVLTSDQIRWFIRNSSAGRVPDYQLSALLMATIVAPYRSLNRSRSLLYISSIPAMAA